MKKFIILFLLFSLFIAGCSKKDDTYNISGTLANKNKEPISDILIKAGNDKTTYTNESGEWMFSDLEGETAITPADDKILFEPDRITVSSSENNIEFIGKKAATVFDLDFGKYSRVPTESEKDDWFGFDLIIKNNHTKEIEIQKIELYNGYGVKKANIDTPTDLEGLDTNVIEPGDSTVRFSLAEYPPEEDSHNWRVEVYLEENAEQSVVVTEELDD
ncbi:MAG: hypothetical protein ACLFT6_03860 [Bacteroidales bacterium]